LWGIVATANFVASTAAHKGRGLRTITEFECQTHKAKLQTHFKEKSAMSHPLNSHPKENEYAPYYGRYISLVPAGDFFLHMNKHFDETLGFLRNLTETQAGTRYEPGKWSVKEVLGHVIDTERIMSYRALRIARADETPLPGFEQDDFVRAANFDSRTLDDLLTEFQAVRAATVALLRSLDEKALGRRGTASTFPVTVRALAYIIAGHERHHLNVLRTKYLPVLA
jgi:hypothetical protein